MNHPKREEWVPYLFGETSSTIDRQLEAHLQGCPECRQDLDGWKNSLGRLDAWKLPRAATAREMVQPLFKWAVAAAIVLAAGFGIGRITSVKANVEALRAAIEPEMRKQLHQEFAAYANGFEIRRAEDNQAIYAALDRLDAQRIADVLSL